MYVTLTSKVNRQGHVTFSNIFDIFDLGNVRIDTKIEFASGKRVFDLDFQCNVM